MQATIEISEEQAQALIQYCQITRISQNEVFQQALKLFLPTLPSKKKLSDHPAFGSWKNKNIDSLEHQIALREE
jgi:hypothetical protein